MMNGRVDLSPTPIAPYQLFEEAHQPRRCSSGGPTLGNRAQTAVSDLFFSSKNIDAVQEAIRYQVYVRTDGKHIIGRQSEVDLEIVMRSVYLEYARNLPFDVVGQVRELNALVLKTAVPKIVREIDMYLVYRKDISSLPVPLERSQNVSRAGTRSLFMKEF